MVHSHPQAFQTQTLPPWFLPCVSHSKGPTGNVDLVLPTLSLSDPPSVLFALDNTYSLPTASPFHCTGTQNHLKQKQSSVSLHGHTESSTTVNQEPALCAFAQDPTSNRGSRSEMKQKYRNFCCQMAKDSTRASRNP